MRTDSLQASPIRCKLRHKGHDTTEPLSKRSDTRADVVSRGPSPILRTKQGSGASYRGCALKATEMGIKCRGSRHETRILWGSLWWSHPKKEPPAMGTPSPCWPPQGYDKTTSTPTAEGREAHFKVGTHISLSLPFRLNPYSSLNYKRRRLGSPSWGLLRSHKNSPACITYPFVTHLRDLGTLPLSPCF
jgi:hypothetical protein